MFKSPKQLNSYYAGVHGAVEAADQAQKAPSSSFFSPGQAAAMAQMSSKVTDEKQGSSPAYGAIKAAARKLGLR